MCLGILAACQGDHLGALCSSDFKAMSYQGSSEVSQGDLMQDASQITSDNPSSGQTSMSGKTVALSETGTLLIDANSGKFKGQIKKHANTDFFGTKVLCGDLSVVNAGVRPSETKACEAVGLPPDFVRQARRYPSGRAAKLLIEVGYDFDDTITVTEGAISNNYISLANWTALYEAASEIGTTRAKAISRATFEATVTAKFARMQGQKVEVDEMLKFISRRVLLVESNLDYKRAIAHNKQLLLDEIGSDLFDDPKLRSLFTAMPAVGSGEILKCLFGMNQREILEYLDVPDRLVPSLKSRTTPRSYLSSNDLNRIHTLESSVTKRLQKLTEPELDLAELVRGVHKQLCDINDDYMPRPPQKGEGVCTIEDVARFRRFTESKNTSGKASAE
jgi:hypothetical protein